MGTDAATAIVRLREKDVIDDFRKAGATSPADARSLAEIGLEESMAVNRLCKREVLREAAPGRLYLDEEAWSAVLYTRRRMRLVMLVTLSLVALVVLYTVVKLT